MKLQFYRKSRKVYAMLIDSLEQLNSYLANEPVDFYDVGCGHGGSIEWVKKKFNLELGLGFEISVEKAKSASKNGHVVTTLPYHTLEVLKRVYATTFLHCLEHVSQRHVVQELVFKAVNVSSGIVYIRQPFFDADELLSNMGLKLYWSTWLGHPNRMKTADFEELLRNDDMNQKISEYFIYGRTPILDASDECVTSILEEPNFSPKTSQPLFKKNYEKFSFPVYREVVVVILPVGSKMKVKNLLKFHGDIQLLHQKNEL